MSQAQRPNCRLLAVLCGEFSDNNTQKKSLKKCNGFPLSELASTGRLEVDYIYIYIVLIYVSILKYRSAWYW
jgi:hypothetical protein